ncbi:hypothetical protein [Parasphingorhabdus sp.]|uniref:hypothetical protein n=1 Tax=Parasphingorhabdus sp. TaxID=2709688 RepID=UPI003593DC8A
MTRPRPTSFEGELERRLAILARCEDVDRRLPSVDTWVLAAITVGCFAIVLIAQAF